MIAVPDEGQTPAEALIGLRPALVMINGRIKLLSGNLDLGIPLNPFSVDGPWRLSRRRRCRPSALANTERVGQ